MVALLWSLLLSSCLSSVGALSLRGRENPIRRIVTLLQDTQKETEAEGEKEEEAFEKFMCFGTNGDVKSNIASMSDALDER